MITLNYRDSRPIYEQIKESFKRLIVTGAMAPGDRLPSVRTLATQLSINPNTIQRAYNELESEGYTLSVPGKGSFVAPAEDAGEKRRAELQERFMALAAELLFLGVDASTLEAWVQEASKTQNPTKIPEAHRENEKKEERT
ncbi:MAG: GntR family transcriptional regulator [Oscillibacter sp.]|nr:GntR family transcriptional regulator [Oscillibacter sp.]